jgi:membrane-associated phospholipid phosphatase
MNRDRLLLSGSLAQFALLIPLTRWARKHPQPLIEIALSRLLQRKQRSWMRACVLVVNTLTGSTAALNLMAVPVAALLWKRRLRLEALLLGATCWTSSLVRLVFKQAVARPRPKPPLVQVTRDALGKSFPSGHVASAMTWWGWIFALGLLSKQERQSGRRALLALSSICVGITGPARVYLGDHWTTDVLGGYLYGGGWLALSLWVYFRLKARGILPGAR